MSQTENLGRIILLLGLALVAVGLVLLVIGRLGWTPRPLPGDLVFRRPGGVVYLPLTTMLLLSLLGTLVLWVIRWLQR